MKTTEQANVTAASAASAAQCCRCPDPAVIFVTWKRTECPLQKSAYCDSCARLVGHSSDDAAALIRAVLNFTDRYVAAPAANAAVP